MKRLAVIAGGWHWPLHFYDSMRWQKSAKGWNYDFFSVGHREPPASDEKDFIFTSEYSDKPLIKFDRKLYEHSECFLSAHSLKYDGWEYSLEENTIGDIEFLNQWLKKHDWRRYDLICFVHDDTYITSLSMFEDIIRQKADLFEKAADGKRTIASDKESDWLWLSNSTSDNFFHIRNCFDFIKPEIFEMIGGSFDTSRISLNRVGEIETPKSHNALSDWNKCSDIIQDMLKEHNLYSKVRFLSPHYRVSPYAIEGERGFIHKKAWGKNLYEKGLKALHGIG